MRFGVERVIAAGLALLLLSAVVGHRRHHASAHFWIALTLLGVGWNFAFIGATTMVTQCHRPEERNKVQSFNDFLIFGIDGDRLVRLRQDAGAVRLGGGQRRRVSRSSWSPAALLIWLVAARAARQPA